MINFWKLAYETVKKQRDKYKEENKKLERESECEREWFYKYSRELEYIVKHERDTIKKLERENRELKDKIERLK